MASSTINSIHTLPFRILSTIVLLCDIEKELWSTWPGELLYGHEKKLL